MSGLDRSDGIGVGVDGAARTTIAGAGTKRSPTVDSSPAVFARFASGPPTSGTRGPIQVVRLSGSPRERGLAHGAAVADRLEYYWGQLVRDVTDCADPMGSDDLRAWILERSEVALAAAPDLEEEIRGMAEGAGVAYEVALSVNFGEEVCHLASMRSATRRAPTERCLAIVVPPEQSASGGYLLAQTWDGPDWTPDPVLFFVEEDAGRSVYLSDGGWVGGVGLNDRGIGSVHTGVGTSLDGTPGLPYPFIARRILQSGTVEEACAKAVQLPATAGCHFVVCDGERVVDVEVAGDKNATRPMAAPVSTCAHFGDPALTGVENDVDWHRISAYRTERLLDIVSRHGPVEPLDLFALMSDHEEGPLGAMVCRHPETDRSGSRSLGAVVIDMAQATVFGRAGNPCEVRDGFSSSPAVERRALSTP